MRDAAANDAVILFVGKQQKQAADAVAEEASVQVNIINHRWVETLHPGTIQ